MKETTQLTEAQQQQLNAFLKALREGENKQVMDLFGAKPSALVIASTHDAYVRDWEKTKKHMESNLAKGIFPPDTNKEFYAELLRQTDLIMKEKLVRVQQMFEMLYGESLFNYLGTDGKRKRFLGIF